MEAATAESAAKTAAMEAAAETPTGICRGRRKGTERGHRGEGNHRFTIHDNLLTQRSRHKRCRRRIVALWRAEQELNSPARVQNLGVSSGMTTDVWIVLPSRCLRYLGPNRPFFFPVSSMRRQWVM